MGLSPALPLAWLRLGLCRLTARDEVLAALHCILEAVRAVGAGRDGTTIDPERLVHTS